MGNGQMSCQPRLCLWGLLHRRTGVGAVTGGRRDPRVYCGANLVARACRKVDAHVTLAEGRPIVPQCQFIIPILQMRKTEAQRSQLLRGSRGMVGLGSEPGLCLCSLCFLCNTQSVLGYMHKQSAFDYFSCVPRLSCWKLSDKIF